MSRDRSSRALGVLCSLFTAAGVAGVAAAAHAAISDAGAGVEVLAAPPEVLGEEPGVATAAPGPPPAVHPLELAWRSPAADLEERVTRTRRASLELGVWNLDPAARAVLRGDVGGTPVERAGAAVRLAPDLPAARMALAHALWRDARKPVRALVEAAGALAAIPRHLEASLWFAGSVLYIAAGALVLGGFLCVALVGLLAAPHAAHDLGDAVAGSMPAFARAALLLALLLVPLISGEGVFGLAAALLFVGALYGTRRQRGALALAATGILIGAYPGARIAGATLHGFASDPVAEAAYRTAAGFDLPTDLARLEVAADDPLAARALARRARRVGELGNADRYYQALLATEGDDPVVANNAANVRLDLGHMESALELYQRSAKLEPSPVAYYNFSQAHGRVFQVDSLERTLAVAQDLDPEVVAELTALQGTEKSFAVDMPMPRRLLWHRVLTSGAGEDIAAELRAPLAPGRLGEDWKFATAALLLAVGGGTLLGARLRPSRWCDRCGRRQCPRCESGDAAGDVCSRCRRLARETASTHRELRLARIAALDRRERRMRWAAWVAALLVPGSAGQLARRPLRGFLGAVLGVLAAAFCFFHGGVVPDPLVAGEAGPVAFLTLAAGCGLLYALVVLASLAYVGDR